MAACSSARATPRTQTITRGFAPAPLQGQPVDRSASTPAAPANRFMARYAGEWANDTAPSAVDRAIGSATQRQEAMNRYHSVLGHVDRGARHDASSTRSTSA